MAGSSLGTTLFDINSDLGEGFGNYRFGSDAEMMPSITSANIACGYHASDPLVMRETVRLAVQRGVAVGAHPGLPDLLGFGRRWMQISHEDMWGYWTYQLGALGAFANAEGVRLHHSKPHGAMYSLMAADQGLAEAALAAVKAYDPKMLVYFPAPLSPAVVVAAQAIGVQLVGELYVDLQYNAEGRVIVERVKRGVDPQVAVEKTLRFLREGKVRSADGTDLSFSAQSVSVHGDSPNGPEVVKAIREALDAAGIKVTTVSAGNGAPAADRRVEAGA